MEAIQQLDYRLLEALKSARKNADRGRFLEILSSKRRHYKMNKILLPMACVDKDQAKRDIIREKIIFNGVNFLGYQKHQVFLDFLADYTKRLTQKLRWPDQRAEEIFDEILSKTSRTVSGSDSYFLLQNLFQVEGYLLKSRSNEATQAIYIDLVAARGTMLCRISTKNIYGLYDMSAIDDPDQEALPWLKLDTEILENIDFSNSESWARFMKITSPDAEFYKDKPRLFSRNGSKSHTPSLLSEETLSANHQGQKGKFIFFRACFSNLEGQENMTMRNK